MGDIDDESKYMEGNYSTGDPGMVLAEWWEDTKQAQKLSQDAEYMKKVLEYLKEKEEEHHYMYKVQDGTGYILREYFYGTGGQ